MFRTITFVWLSWMQPEKITLAEMRASAICRRTVAALFARYWDAVAQFQN